MGSNRENNGENKITGMNREYNRESRQKERITAGSDKLVGLEPLP